MKPKKIFIIGSGMAGLAAANKLLKHHHNVTVLEARERIGGRTWTDYSMNVPIDLGAFIIHGIIGNPITDLAQRYHAKHMTINLTDEIYFANTQITLPAEELEEINNEYEKLLADASQYAKQASEDMSLQSAVEKIFDRHLYPKLNKAVYAWKSYFLTLYSGAGAKYLSAQAWSDDEIRLEGNHIMLDGYLPIVNGLAKHISIVLNCEVTNINYQNNLVKITTASGIYEADAVIVTIPLGVLQKNTSLFSPLLPQNKSNAIARLGMGVLNKIFLKFPNVFWPAEKKLITLLQDKYTSISWFNNFNLYMHAPILLGVVGGDLAREFEKMNNKEVIHETMQVLKKQFGSSIPEPNQYIITHWLNDPYTVGSYSYIPVGASGEDYDILAESVANKVFFAGEATNRQFPGTTNGAYLSGLRAAVEVMQC